MIKIIFNGLILLIYSIQLFAAEKSKSPYAEMLPWVADSVWEMKTPDRIEDFLREYGLPEKGSTQHVDSFVQHARQFEQNFHGFQYQGQFYAVVEKELDAPIDQKETIGLSVYFSDSALKSYNCEI